MIWLLGGYMWLFVHRPFEVWPALGALQIERAYMILMLLVWLFSPKGWIANRMHAVTAFFTIALFMTWMLSPFMDQLKPSQTIEDFFKVLVFYVLVITSVRDERTLKLLITLFVGAVAVYMAHSFREFLAGRYEYRMGIRRMNGVDTSFGDPNGFASTLLYTVPLALSLWMTKPDRLLRLCLIGHFLGVCMCIVLTGSRSALMGLCLWGFLSLLVWVRRKALVVLLTCVAGVMALGVAIVAMPPELQNRYLTIIDSSYGPKNAAESANARLEFFLKCVQAWHSSPVIGHGPRSFDFLGGNGQGCHNLYGQILCEMGGVGVLAMAGYLACFLLNWREIHRYYQDHPERPRDFVFYLSRNMVILLVLLLVLGCGGHTLYRYNWRWYAAFQIIAVHCIRKREQDSQYLCSLYAVEASAAPLAA
ncbi:MAG TPA: O-antigen ligase family protein [Gemmataceae bacterium]|nr:O-antigen ligase family protein [Gemmataceae bacterium]